MKVDLQMVEHLAHLSRLTFEAAEKEQMRQDMEKIISFVEQLNSLDTTGVEPLRHMSGVEDVTRADESQVTITREQALASAAKHDGVFFKVPKVIRK